MIQKYKNMLPREHRNTPWMEDLIETEKEQLFMKSVIGGLATISLILIFFYLWLMWS